MYKQNNFKIFLGKKGYIRLFQTKSNVCQTLSGINIFLKYGISSTTN